ncbi:hypothetical protein [Pseudomonas syringae]|uniref:Uncharacterized protein n=1 Tax=Pseudomonas syringae pv. papulans TaxID=83963 RepID=A0AA43DVA1_PSESX|nr:hypothetical protein [Pseudomonas syringae]KPY30289.1 Uncharacterized protein ALO65_02433 [Pseudomonas syringae pv. papulans]KWS32825.1 hypothetical protein AL059_13265 [Pseudomonas syringae pv. papulans]MDH4606296.1 hypothetical protein [Pseudomonas syringae pv. papulans]MDH4623157.1 hypothetical protein [Pseudomonas syringae pv. papulans]POP83764.1 hypothetical protein CXB38_00270 [Pseudomonas syringae]
MAKLTQFQHGIFYSVASIVRLHGEPRVAADLLINAGLGNLNCSELEEYEKEMLRAVNTENGMPLTGLHG